MHSHKALLFGLPLFALIVIGVTVWKVGSFIVAFPQSNYTFQYGPYTCGTDTLTVDEHIRRNNIEGGDQYDYRMTFGDHLFTSTFDTTLGHASIYPPKTGIDSTSSYLVIPDTGISLPLAQSFTACFTSHQSDLYAAMAKNYNTFESGWNSKPPALEGVSLKTGYTGELMQTGGPASQRVTTKAWHGPVDSVTPVMNSKDVVYRFNTAEPTVWAHCASGFSTANCKNLSGDQMSWSLSEGCGLPLLKKTNTVRFDCEPQ